MHDDAMFEEIEIQCSAAEHVDEKTIRSVSSRLSTLKSGCRNMYIPQYLKETKVKQSGEYIDDDILLNIYETAVKARVDANCYRTKKIIVAEMKSKNTSVEEIVDGEKKM